MDHHYESQHRAITGPPGSDDPWRSGFPAPAPAGPSALSPVALLGAARRRWKAAVVLGAASAAAVAAAAWAVLPPSHYTARALLQVSAVPPRIIFNTAETRADFGTFQRTQLTMIKSRQVLSAALNRPEVGKLGVVGKQADPVEWLGKEVRVNFPNGAEVMEVAMVGDDPGVLAAVVNAVTDAYLSEVVYAEYKGRQARHDQLKAIWGGYQDALQAKRDRLRKLAESVGSDDKPTLTLKQQYDVERAAVVRRELFSVRSEARRLRIELDLLKGGPEPEGSTDEPALAREVEARVEADAGVRAYADRVAKLQERVKSVSRMTRNPASDPSVRPLLQQLDAARRGMQEHRVRVRAVIAREVREAARGADEAEARAARLAQQIAVYARLEAALNEELAGLKDETRALNATVLDLGSIQEEVAHAEAAAKTVGAEIEALNVELSAPPRVRLFEKAEPPRTKDEMKKVRTIATASLGALAATVLGVSLWEYRARKVSSVDEVIQTFGVKVLGALPTLPRASRAGAAGPVSDRERRWYRLLVESVDATRTIVLHAASRAGAARVIMVVSANVGEGKTSLSTLLSTSLARSGRRTLIADLDLRRPTAHRLCGVPLTPGFSEHLRGEVSLASTIKPTLVDGLWIIPAGRSDNRTIAALARKDLRATFRQLAGEFDFLVIDSAPLLAVADSLLIAQHVDGVIFSILQDVSRVPEVHAACERLGALGVRMLGAVVSGARAEGYRRSYGYGYGDHRAPGADRDG